ncbi:penicillin acylase family protein [bacterium]|nr:penicillin acylase family protein [bacterium]
MSISRVVLLAALFLSSSAQAIELKGKECQIWQDTQGISHLRAESETVVFGCLGYLHGRDRAFQMDFLRRTVQGRRAEILGYKGIRSDFMLRVMGLYDQAKTIYAGLAPQYQEAYVAYAHGVNRGFQQGGTEGFEFRELGYTPEPWRPEDSVAMMMLQSFDQTRRTFANDMQESRRKSQFGDLTERLFSLDGLPWDTSILKSGEYVAKSREGKPQSSLPSTGQQTSSATLRSIEKLLGLNDAGVETGSNQWVLAPARSTTGNAWFANDPHLSLKSPPFWYWVHISGGALDAIGGSLPGVPMIASGANQKVAWGPTNAYIDVADVFSVPESEVAGQKSIRPTIWFKLWGPIQIPFVFKTFTRTEEGWPVLPLSDSDVPWKEKKHALVLRWTGFDLTAKDFEHFFDIMRASTVEDMSDRVSLVGIPSWNFVFADTQGHIGYRLVGRVPKRGSDNYGVPSLTSLKQIPTWPLLNHFELPHVTNPHRGFVVGANNRQWPSDSAFLGGRSYRTSLRAFRIEELLEKTPKHDLKSIQKIQCDQQAVDARFLLPLLTDAVKEKVAKNGNSSELSALKELETWDLDTSTRCKACPIYRRWTHRIDLALGLEENALYRSLSNPHLPELVDSIYKEYVEAIADVGWVSRENSKTWGDLHVNFFRHLSTLPAFDVKDPLPTSGDENTVNPGSADWDAQNKRYEQESGASHRLIVEMSNPVKVYLTTTGLNQDLKERDLNKAGSPWSQWNKCEYMQLHFPLNWDQVSLTKFSL